MYIKTDFRLKAFHTHSNDTTLSKVFICFIASIIRSVLVDKTRKLREGTKDTKNYTVRSSILEMAKIEATRTALGSGRRIRYILTNKQRRILHAFDMEEEAIDKELDSFKDLDQIKAGKKI